MCATELFNLIAIYASILNHKTSLQCIHHENRTETWVFCQKLALDLKNLTTLISTYQISQLSKSQKAKDDENTLNST